MALFAELLAIGLLVSLAQEPSGPATSVPDVLVTTTREQRVREYVDVLPEVNRPDEPLARFDRHVCPGVINMDAHARAIVDRIAATATAAGLSVGAPGCSPNIVVIFTLDPDTMAADLSRKLPYVFEQVASSRRSGRTQLREFVTSDAPVRWWHSTYAEVANVGTDLGLITENDPAVGSMYRGSGAARSRPGSLLSSASRMDINVALVIVDMTRIEAVELNAISDYAAFVALAQIDPSADLSGADTILNLFEPGAGRISGLSQFDRTYLRALYRSRGDAARASQQKSEIAAEMVRDLGRETTPLANGH